MGTVSIKNSPVFNNQNEYQDIGHREMAEILSRGEPTEIGYSPVGVQNQDEFELVLLYSAIYGYAIQALEAIEDLELAVFGISGEPNVKLLKLAKNHISEYAAEAMCALKEPYDWWEGPLDQLVNHVLQKGANNGNA